MYENEMKTIYNKLKAGLPDVWNGYDCIKFMKDNKCRNWRQMEWPGFYFEFMCDRILSQGGYMQVPGPKYGNVEFDGFKIIPWDFKAHSIDPNKSDDGKVPTNGYNECNQALDDYGNIIFIVMNGECEYDDDQQTFKKWHDKLKGGRSTYEAERIQRGAPSRRRKVIFNPVKLTFATLNKDNIGSCGKFQSGFRNSDGTPRNAKVLLDLKRNDKLIINEFDF